MKHIIKCLIPSIILGLINGIYTKSIQCMNGYEIIKLESFDILPDAAGIMDITRDFLPFIVFQILFGTFIYRHYCTASVYFFSRNSNRSRWYVKEMAKLAGFSFMYTAAYMLSCIFMVSMRLDVTIGYESVVLLAAYICLTAMWLYITTGIINIISIAASNIAGFAIMETIQIVMISLLLIWDKWLPLVTSDTVTAEMVQHNASFLRLNPVSHIVVAWHSSVIADVDEVINRFNIQYDLLESFTFFIMISVITIIIGVQVVKKHDYINSDVDNGR